MGRLPCCDKGEVKKGAWTPEEDKLLLDYITKNGHGTWRSFPKLAGMQFMFLSLLGFVHREYFIIGLRRCGKSCRLRWTNYLRPDIKRGTFSFEEEQIIFQLHSLLGNKWAAIAARLPGRTDNEIKNYWNSHLRKRIPSKGVNLQTKSADTNPKLLSTNHMAEWDNARVEVDARSSMVDPILLSPATGVGDCDYFLRAWNSEAGEAFQRAKDFNQAVCSIPSPQASSLIKVESDSVVTMQAEPTFTVTSTGASCDQSVGEHLRCKIEAEEATNTASYSPNSYKAEKSSDITLDLLLDFPNDGEYLEYLQAEPSDNTA